MQSTFNLAPMEYTYAASLFYRKSSPFDLEEHISIPDILFVLNLVIIITLGFTIITYCWFKLQPIFLKTPHSQSRITLGMQHQLFQSLVAQTIFPVFLLFIPAGALFSFPMLKFEPGSTVESIILPLMATQPVIDSLVPMYFIKNYRKAIRRVFVKVSAPETSTRGPARVCPI